jgi:hypothetical protein
MKMYCATTVEIDDPELAVEQILEQLDLPKNQLKNSLGLIAMFGEFYDTGVYGEIVRALPFPCIGYTSSFCGSNGEAGDMLLSVVMMTSDTNTFGTYQLNQTDTLNRIEDTRAALNELKEEVYAQGKPSLIMPYFGLTPSTSSDDLLTMLDETFDHTPVFGSVIFSSDQGQFVGFACKGDGEKCFSEMVFVVVYGELNPHFMIVTGINETVRVRNPGKVTKAVSNTLFEVNGITTKDYLVKVGIMGEGINTDSMWVLPALVENKERGTSKVRAFVRESPFHPGAFFASGNIETGNMISFGALDATSTNESAFKAFNDLVEEGAECFLGISCVARSWANGTEYLREFKDIAKVYESVKNEKGRVLNYQVINSGGEICPVVGKGGELVNTLNNYSLVIMYFKD